MDRLGVSLAGEVGASAASDHALAGLPNWDLTDLYSDKADPRLETDLDAAKVEVDGLANDFAGKLADIDGDRLAELIERYESLSDNLGRIGSYAQLLHATQRDNAEIGQFYQGIQERINTITTKLLFVTLEINKLDDKHLTSLRASSERLRHYEPWLRDVRSFRPHQLDDEIERVLHEKSVVGRRAWVRLFDETIALLRFPFDGKDLTSTEIFDKLTDNDRSIRETAYGSIAGVLTDRQPLFARITNTLAKDKHIEDEWRHFQRPISSRNLSNQVEDEVVDALIGAVHQSYPRLSHRYYTLKARWMGLEKLELWDRNAPLPEDSDERRPWTDAKVIVLNAYRSFSPKLADIVGRFFDQQWIDAAPKQGKDSGAFCHPTVPSAHPFVLMNYQGRNRDIMTLAHELGHGVHQCLAAARGALMAGAPLTLAETASVFGEQLTFRALLEQESDPARRRILLAAKIEDMLNTVVRQIAFCEFERQVHDARREAELTPEQLGEVWMSVQQDSLGPAFNYGDEYQAFWTYIPHFIHVPFYVYAYAFGDCLVNSLYAVYQSTPEGFEHRYLTMLEAGGTLRHKELLAPFGLDASDPAFWDRGLDMISDLIDRLDGELKEIG